MKKLCQMLLMATMVLGCFMAVDGKEASAQTGSAGYCGAKVYNDATNYTTSATSVDFYAYKSSCGTLYYKARLYQVGDGNANTGLVRSGSFANRTPTKTFLISDIKRNTPYPKSGAEKFRIEFSFYSNSSYTNYVGSASSATFNVY